MCIKTSLQEKWDQLFPSNYYVGMRQRMFFLPIVLLVTVVSCNQQLYTVDALPSKDYLAFGSGGGFSGLTTTWYIFPNGQVFKSIGTAEAAKTPQGQLKKKQVRRLFKQCESTLAVAKIDQPNNVTHFIRRVTEEGDTVQLRWGSDAPEAVASLFKNLQKVVADTTAYSQK
ncbi:MAG: hypothetical protein R2795_12870 [Saprospiraceae bacterium]